MIVTVARTLARKVLFAPLPLLALLVLVELALRAAPDAIAAYSRLTTRLRPDATTYIVTMGDSVTAGSRLAEGASWPAQLRGLYRAEGQSSVEVVNTAISGSRMRDIEGRQVRWLENVPAGSNLVVLLLATHNDFSQWMSATEYMAKSGAGTGVGEESNLRVFNVVQWLFAGSRAHASLDASAETWLVRELTTMKAAVAERGGTLYVLTYAIPGPAESLPMRLTLGEYDDYRSYAHRTNRMLVRAAYAVGARTMDLEAELPVPVTFDPDFWIDTVHFTEKGSAAVAKHVREELREDGF